MLSALLAAATAAKLKVVAAVSMIGAGATTALQAIDLSGFDLDQLVAGGVISGAGIWALLAVIRASNHERGAAESVETKLDRMIARLETTIDDLETQLQAANARTDNANARARRLLIAYDRERSTRLALEAAGLIDRRDLPPELEADAIVTDDDHIELLTDDDLEANQ